MVKKTLLAAALLALPALCLFGQARESRPPLRALNKNSQAKFDSVHSFDVQSYTLRITLPMNSDWLYGQQLLTAAAVTDGLDTVTLNCANLMVDSVKQGDSIRGWRLASDTLYAGIAPTAASGHFALEIFYRLGGRGSNRLGYYWYPQGGEALRPVGYTMSAPQDARAWMPCFDEPWDKADSGCSFYVTVPQGYTVAANGLLQDTAAAGGSVTWHWREDHAIATYLMALHASQYAFWTDTARTAAGDTVPLNYFVWPQDSALSRAVFDSVPSMIDCFSRKFGRYPFAKYGMAAVAPFMFGGMENQTITTIIRSWLTSNDQFGIAHELSHMWYGDLVTCGTWADIWLNEGFASYCEAIYYESRTGNKPGLYMNASFASATTGNAEVHSVYDPPLALIYDVSMEYAKGAWVLQMLRGVMGDSAFFAGMRQYAAAYSYRTAITAEFQSVMEGVYGAPLDWFFNEWVHRAGHPNYTAIIYYRTYPDSLAALLRLKQTSTTGELYTMPLQLACSTAAGITSQPVLWDSLPLQELAFSATQPIRRIMIDPDSWVLKTAGEVKPQLNKVLKGVRRLTSVWRPFTADPSGIAGYDVYRSNSSGGPFARINGAIITDTVYADTGLAPGVMQYYAITAVCLGDTNSETRFSNVTGNKPLGIEGSPATAPLPPSTRLERGRPNPFALSTVIAYQLAAPGSVDLRIYNAAGQLVRTLVGRWQPAGRYSVIWNGADDRDRPVAAGLYYYCLAAGGKKLVRSLQYIK